MIFERPECHKGGLGAGTKTRSAAEIQERVRYCKFLIPPPSILDFSGGAARYCKFLIGTPPLMLDFWAANDGLRGETNHRSS